MMSHQLSYELYSSTRCIHSRALVFIATTPLVSCSIGGRILHSLITYLSPPYCIMFRCILMPLVLNTLYRQCAMRDDCKYMNFEDLHDWQGILNLVSSCSTSRIVPRPKETECLM